MVQRWARLFDAPVNSIQAILEVPQPIDAHRTVRGIRMAVFACQQYARFVPIVARECTRVSVRGGLARRRDVDMVQIGAVDCVGQIPCKEGRAQTIRIHAYNTTARITACFRCSVQVLMAAAKEARQSEQHIKIRTHHMGNECGTGLPHLARGSRTSRRTPGRCCSTSHT